MLNNIPTIDLKPLLTDNLDGVIEISNQLKSDFAKHGFAYLVNHGIKKDLIETIFKEAHRFHSLPIEEKLKIKHNDAFRGYLPNKSSQIKMSTEGVATKPNLIDSFTIMFEVDENHPDYKECLYFAGPNQWPNNLPGFKEVICQYRDAMMHLSYKLIHAFSIALGMDMHGLDKMFVDPTYFLRLQHYPAQVENFSEDQFGLAPHTDAGFMTILAQDPVIEGLKIKSIDDQWINVPYVPDTLVLNAGYMLQRLSNDKFRAVPHSVINKSSQDRYSVPFFFDTNMHVVIEPLKSCITSESPAKYPPIMYGEYLVDRLQGNYGLGKRR